jgi:hypothetical protein
MNTELINHLKDTYKTFLFTEEGRELLSIAINQKREWNDIKKRNITTTSTDGVKLKFINKIFHTKIHKVDIIPIGLNNVCHRNAEFFCDDDLEITKKIGYNITACPCGKCVSFELHSVNKYKNKLYDFTKDFNDETNKYFMELDTNIDIYEFITIFGREKDFIKINKGCRCPINWGKKYQKTDEEFIEIINNIERIKIYC